MELKILVPQPTRHWVSVYSPPCPAQPGFLTTSQSRRRGLTKPGTLLTALRHSALEPANPFLRRLAATSFSASSYPFSKTHSTAVVSQVGGVTAPTSPLSHKSFEFQVWSPKERLAEGIHPQTSWRPGSLAHDPTEDSDSWREG